MNRPVIPEAETCTLCGFCTQVCPTRALRWVENLAETTLILSPADCDGCGQCVQVCDFKAIDLLPFPVKDRENVVLRRSPVVSCNHCSAPVASQAELAYIARQVGNAKWLNLCLDCRGLA